MNLKEVTFKQKLIINQGDKWRIPGTISLAFSDERFGPLLKVKFRLFAWFFLQLKVSLVIRKR